ncbi:TraR/DksA C4-type zinc finger protein [Paenibacillus glufosinatiresistens]|uniref:TraR/DksA C4-type zinc finger protein n=1 Tax=Paenibacillus glufosinatiresistens TaxID=3070657 RepID=UPI00286DCCBA|nr:TraR/DksA C4-type zinc finger protein [Paenibacillus sp. YX.27]
MNHLTAAQLAGLRQQLEQRQSDIRRRLQENDHYGLAESMRDNTGELSEIDNHPADAATDLFQREMDISLLEREELELADVDAALEAMNDGTYGICQATGEPIAYERLRAIPWTRYSKDSSPKQEKPHTRPVEEDFLMPPFGRSSLDEHEYSGFDGEDAWQIVESYGSSTTPAMAEGNNIDSYNEVEIEADENEGWVEAWENFVATDITGTEVFVVEGDPYRRYLDSGEGDYLLDPNGPRP